MEFPCLKHPFSMLICGPSNSGKTFFVKRLIEEDVIKSMPQKIIWCYGAYQKLFSELPHVDFYEGLPQDIQHVSNALIIIDDLMSELGDDSTLSKLFTKGSHHRNLSVIFIVQNIFHQGKEMRNISLNTSYMTLFKNVRDKQQISCLARQMFPEDPKYFMECFNIATAEPFGYLFLDLKPDTDDRFLLRAGIFPSDKLSSTFMPQDHPYVRWFDSPSYDPSKLLEYMQEYDKWKASHSTKPFIPKFKSKEVNEPVNDKTLVMKPLASSMNNNPQNMISLMIEHLQNKIKKEKENKTPSFQPKTFKDNVTPSFQPFKQSEKIKKPQIFNELSKNNDMISLMIEHMQNKIKKEKESIKVNNPPSFQPKSFKDHVAPTFQPKSFKGNVTPSFQPKQGDHVCSKCSTTFAHYHHLIRHQKSKHEDISHICKICQKTFTRKDILTRHMHSHN